MLSEVLGQESWMGAESGEEGMTGDALDRVVIPGVAAGEGEGVDSGDAGIVRRGEVG